MPEGDTIYRLAQALRPLLEGETVEQLYLRRVGDLLPLQGKKAQRIDTKGKNLLIFLEAGWVYWTHLGLHGDVRRYKRGSGYSLSDKIAALVKTKDNAFLWINASKAEVFREKELAAHPSLSLIHI